MRRVKKNRGGNKKKEKKEENYRSLRRIAKYKTWRKKCLIRDNYQCQICGVTVDLTVHHIKSFRFYPGERFNVRNGITFCWDCHEEVENEKY